MSGNYGPVGQAENVGDRGGPDSDEGDEVPPEVDPFDIGPLPPPARPILNDERTREILADRSLSPEYAGRNCRDIGRDR